MSGLSAAAIPYSKPDLSPFFRLEDGNVLIAPRQWVALPCLSKSFAAQRCRKRLIRRKTRLKSQPSRMRALPKSKALPLDGGSTRRRRGVGVKPQERCLRLHPHRKN